MFPSSQLPVERLKPMCNFWGKRSGAQGDTGRVRLIAEPGVYTCRDCITLLTRSSAVRIRRCRLGPTSRDHSSVISAGSLSQGQFAALVHDVRTRSPRTGHGA